MKKLDPIALLPLFLLLPGCLENEEDIEVRADGSVRVVVRAKGDVGDLADGYPIALGPAWKPGSRDTYRWLERLGEDTGSGAARARLDEDPWPTDPNGDGPEATLVAVREFGSVEDWPRWFAPESEPYRTAYLERSASLEIKELASHTVYVFERTFHGIDRARLDPIKRIEQEVGHLLERFDEQEPYSPGEWREIHQSIVRAHQSVAESFARDALLALFTDGDVAVRAAVIPRVIGEVRAAAEDIVTMQSLRNLHDAVLADDDETAGAILEEYESGYRDEVRDSLASSLAAARVEDHTINAALFALEWGFTAFDHFGDLADEKFAVSLSLPGTIIDGNFDESVDSEASWSFDGKELHEGDVVLRAVSVLER